MNVNKPLPRKEKKAAIDWHEIRQRIESARTAIERGWTPDAEQTRQILKARAQALAREPGKMETAAECLEAVEFLLAGERYAVESRHVREIFPLENLTPLPGTPAFVLGIINIRGEILSVIDIKKFFELPDKGLTDLNKVIVLQSESMLFGILADVIAGVRQIPATGIQPSLPTLTGIREEYLRGITAERTIILDAEKLLADEKIIVQEQVEG